jgi:hypothetical protein
MTFVSFFMSIVTFIIQNYTLKHPQFNDKTKIYVYLTNLLILQSESQLEDGSILES